MISPTMLFGVDAPAVSPTMTGPSGSQSRVTTSGTFAVEATPIGRCRISLADIRHSRSAM